MGLHLRYALPVTAAIALVGLGACALFKSKTLRAVAVGAIRGGVKATDWVGDKLACAKKNLDDMVAEAKAPVAEAPASEPEKVESVETPSA